MTDYGESVDWVLLGKAVDAEVVKMLHHEDPPPDPIKGTYTIEALRRVLRYPERFGLIEKARADYVRESHEIVNLANLEQCKKDFRDWRLRRRLEGVDLRKAIADDLRGVSWRVKGKYRLEGFELAIKWLQGGDLGE